jgi:hypothetical protein
VVWWLYSVGGVGGADMGGGRGGVVMVVLVVPGHR